MDNHWNFLPARTVANYLPMDCQRIF